MLPLAHAVAETETDPAPMYQYITFILLGPILRWPPYWVADDNELWTHQPTAFLSVAGLTLPTPLRHWPNIAYSIRWNFRTCNLCTPLLQQTAQLPILETPNVEYATRMYNLGISCAWFGWAIGACANSGGQLGHAQLLIGKRGMPKCWWVTGAWQHFVCDRGLPKFRWAIGACPNLDGQPGHANT